MSDAHARAKKTQAKKMQVYIAFIAAYVVFLALLVFGNFFVYDSQIQTKYTNELARLSLQNTEALAKKLETQLLALDQQVGTFALPKYLPTAERESTENTITQEASTNQSSSEKAIENQVLSETPLQERMRAQLPELRSFRYFHLGEVKLDQHPELPVRYTELDMLRRAEKQEAVPPEAIKSDKSWLVLFAKPVISAAQVLQDKDQQAKNQQTEDSSLNAEEKNTPLGSLLLAMDIGVIERILFEGNKVNLGKIVVQQNFENRTVNDIVRFGSGALASKQSIKLDIGHWQLSFTPNDTLAAQINHGSTLILIAMAIVSLLIFVPVTWFCWRLSRRYMHLKTNTSDAPVNISDLLSSEPINENYIDPIYHQQDILDVDVDDDNEALMAFDDEEEELLESETTSEAQNQVTTESKDAISIPDEVFRSYDILGKVGDQITEEFAFLLGQAYASDAIDKGEDTLIIARDTRSHSMEIAESLIKGVLSTGCHVANLGAVPLPLLYFAAETMQESNSGIMVTGAEQTAEANGFKFVLQGQPRFEHDILALRQRIKDAAIHHGVGQSRDLDIADQYIDSVCSDVALASDYTLVVDAANAVAGTLAPRLFEELGCRVIPLFCDPQGDFPNHPPDTNQLPNLQALIEKVKSEGADLGIAIDGDGDQLAVVTQSGRVLTADQLLILFAREVLSRNPGADVIFDVKSSRKLANIVSSEGGRAIMWQTGHAPMWKKMLETGALIGGESSGYIFIKDRWHGFADGLYAGARFLELISLQEETLDEISNILPSGIKTEDYFADVDEERKQELIDKLIETGNFGNGLLSKIDGLRVDFSKGWGLVRPCRDKAQLTLCFEAEDAQTLKAIKTMFAREIKRVDSAISIEWDK